MGSATHDWPGHVDSVSLLHTVLFLQMKSYASQEDFHFSRWFQQTLVLLKNSPARFPAKESNSEADPFFMSEWSTVVWVGTCCLLIQIYEHFILSKCTSSNTATSVSCETTNCWMLGYLLKERLRICFRMRGLQMACVCIWVARLNLSGIAKTTTS